jgi:hypothetical protein
MINFDASSPHLSVVKQWLESYQSLDTENVDPLLSKNFQYETYPRSPNAPNQSKKAHLEQWGAGLPLMNKLEASSIQQTPGIPPSRLDTDIHHF